MILIRAYHLWGALDSDQQHNNQEGKRGMGETTDNRDPGNTRCMTRDSMTRNQVLEEQQESTTTITMPSIRIKPNTTSTS